MKREEEQLPGKHCSCPDKGKWRGSEGHDRVEHGETESTSESPRLPERMPLMPTTRDMHGSQTTSLK